MTMAGALAMEADRKVLDYIGGLSAKFRLQPQISSLASQEGV